MDDRATPLLTNDLYERDFCAWAEEQARLLRERRFGEIDLERLTDEVDDLAQRHRDEIESRLGKLLSHLLKWQIQPEGRCGSGRATILEQRTRIAKRLLRSPSLRDYPESVLGDEYALARREAAAETGTPLERLPSESPFTIAQILDMDYFPDAEDGRHE
jgi:hypothetical protein